MTARYAIYFSPEDSSELSLFGATVLRRHALDATDWLNPELPVEFPESCVWSDQINKPAQYGFHATIKAPFELAEGQSADNLISELVAFCNTQTLISLQGLAPVRTCRYDALAFVQQPEALPPLAAACVKGFEHYRAPLHPADVERRNPASLSESELANLHQYGYPYILNDFNFHMTLSGQNSKDADHDNLAYFEWLCDLYKTMVKTPPVLDRLCVFQQPDRQSPFIRLAECLFGIT